MVQEISELLAGKMSNQDEDEVEDELADLEREVNGVTTMPNPPVKQPELTPKERALRRQREREAQEAAAEEESPQPMLA